MLTDRERLIREMQDYAKRAGIELSTLSTWAGRNSMFYERVVAGRYFPDTGEKVRAWMRANPPTRKRNGA